ncbi:unnamed protein product [Adineta steineri]|uniref:ADP ribosyltransferase domain-containing protein n=1 Tax=Adineta steineri TaxID=433720 RepID=A0A813R7D8_9BILA|nr:unnamed protein product [Adineta steineri]CAF4060594.1 unnamed protein product [Adineta steineri]
MGFFVRDLHRQIEQLYTQMNIGDSLIVYRGQGIIHSEFQKLKKSQAGLLSFNNFLSTSTDRQVAALYAESASQNPDLIGILFQMEIDPTVSTAPFVSLDNISHFGDQEKEILFSTHTIFRIGKMEQVQDHVWIINLILTKDDDVQLMCLTRHMRKMTQQPTAIHRLGSLMIKMGEFNKAKEIYTTLLERTSDNDRQQRAQVYHQLGFINAAGGELTSALSHYQQSLKIYLTYMASDDPQLSPTFSNTGSVFKQQGDLERALQYFEHALYIDLHSPQSNRLKIATDYNNIGGVLHDKDPSHRGNLAKYNIQPNCPEGI